MNVSIDVLIVTKNRSMQLERCIRSILKNTYLPKRMVIVDSSDVSDNKLYGKLEKLGKSKKVKIKFIHTKSHGISFSRNIAISHSRSKYYCFIDDDEIAPPRWIEIAIKTFSDNSNIDVITGPKKPIDLKSYWNRVWESMYIESYKSDDDTKFADGGNSFYKTKFVKENKIYFDTKINWTYGEDSVYSHLLRSKNARIYHKGSLFVYHEFRSSLFGFVKTWFFYGTGAFKYYKFFVFDKPISRWYKIHYIHRMATNGVALIQPKHVRLKLFFGHVVKNISFYLGYLYSYAFNKI